MSGKIWLITEDENDSIVIQKLLDAHKIHVEVDWQKTTGGGISRLVAEVEKLIQTAKKRKDRKDCIAVLHDWDEHKQPDRRIYDQIKTICYQYRRDAVLVIARQSIEAWLLADSGICDWLGIRPKNWDESRDPKSELNRHLKKIDKKLKFPGRYTESILSHAHGDGYIHSPSMRAALKHLDDAPCIEK